jgi:hypothetical protein
VIGIANAANSLSFDWHAVDRPVDGGVEDVLPSLAFLICRYALSRGLEQIESRERWGRCNT